MPNVHFSMNNSYIYLSLVVRQTTSERLHYCTKQIIQN